MQAANLVGDLKAQGDSALPVVQVQRRRGHVVERRRGGRGKGLAIAGGIAAAAAAAVILSQGANAAPARGDGYGYGYGRNSCRRWFRLCDEGEGWACRRVRREC